jgi:hypothetical protein
MTVFFIDIGDNIFKPGLEVLIDYCTKNNLKYYILKENAHKVHPSWLKLKCFDYVDDDFVLCWDTDLLPLKNTENINDKLNLSELNLVKDSSLYLNLPNDARVKEYFTYNCGLIGIPKKFKFSLNEIFELSSTSQLPSYEQYPFNNYIKQNNVKINELDKEWNTLFHLPTNEHSFITKSKLIHYTGSTMSQNDRQLLITKHNKKYFKN